MRLGRGRAKEWRAWRVMVVIAYGRSVVVVRCPVEAWVGVDFGSTTEARVRSEWFE